MKKIAIVTSNHGAYSETFIKAQIDLLPANILLYDGLLPKYYNDKKLIFSLNKIERVINRISFLFFKNIFFTYGKALNRILKNNDVKVILAQYGLSGVEMLAFCKKYKFDLIVHFHGFDASIKEVLETNRGKYYEMFHFAKKIVVVSIKMEQTIIDLGCPKEKILLNHYGPNDIFFENEPNFSSDVFFSIGRFVDKKAPYLTLIAFYELQKEFSTVKLRMAGTGELLNTCKNMVKAWSIEDKVEFLGVIKPEQTKYEMENALAFVQHSLVADSGDSEGTPVAVLEAQAAALPVISTFHAGIPDVVLSGKTGILVNETDVFGMKEAMKEVFLNRDYAKILGRNGRKRIKQNFTMHMYIERLRNCINEI